MFGASVVRTARRLFGSLEIRDRMFFGTRACTLSDTSFASFDIVSPSRKYSLTAEKAPLELAKKMVLPAATGGAEGFIEKLVERLAAKVLGDRRSPPFTTYWATLLHRIKSSFCSSAWKRALTLPLPTA